MKFCSNWVWEKELPHETCQKIINLGEGKWNEGVVNKNTGTKRVDDKIRQSDIVWVNDKWIYDLVMPYMFTANERAGWKYNIVSAEECQITRYTPGEFYTWHKDGLGSHKEVYDNGNTRKITISVTLNSDFEGGELQFHGLTTHTLEAGSIVVFPSFLDHRVTPVTKGIRYSLIIWFLGPPFI
jgi:PKHD-type hydroxylase